MPRSKSGFTLVELLIVIVVIAILAAISVVAYNGIQQRAYASQAAAAVDGAVKILEMYKIDNGDYPDSDGDYVCLTASGSLPDIGNLAENQCDTGTGASISLTLNSALSTYVASISNNTLPVVDYGHGAARSLMYSADGGMAILAYFVNGNQDCPRGDKDPSFNGATLCMVQIGTQLDDSGGGVLPS